MNRLEAAAGLGVLALAVAGLGTKYVELRTLAMTPDPSREGHSGIVDIRPIPTLEAAAGGFVSAVEAADESGKLAQVAELLAAVEMPQLMDDEFDPQTAETLAKTLVATIESSPDQSPEGLELRRRAVGLLASRVPSPASKAYVLKVIEEGPQLLRDEAVAKAGSPRGVRGASVYEKIKAAGEKGLIPDELHAQALRRTGGLKAKDALVALMRSTDSARLISGCAVALQDYRKPELLGDVLHRLEQLGRLDSAGKLPWIGAELLHKHMQDADRPQFRRGLTAMSARPSLFKLEHAKAGLESPDVETRKVAIAAVRKAVSGKVLSAQEGETVLAGRIEAETEPVLKAELTGGVERFRSMQQLQ